MRKRDIKHLFPLYEYTNFCNIYEWGEHNFNIYYIIPSIGDHRYIYTRSFLRDLGATPEITVEWLIRFGETLPKNLCVFE